MAGGGAPLAAIADRAGDLCKIARLAEVLVDAREANVGDMVADVLDGLASKGLENNGEVERQVNGRVRDICARFPIYQDS